MNHSISESKHLKREAELKINKILSDLSEQIGLRINDVNLVDSWFGTKPSYYVSIKIHL